jgi:hypothetical protein
MRVRTAFVLAALLLAPALFAGTVPRFFPHDVVVHVGETIEIKAVAAQSGLTTTPSRWNWHFWSTDPAIAAIDGALHEPDTEGVVRITGLAEGVTGIVTDGGYVLPPASVTVICGESVPVTAESPVVTAKPGQKTTLHAIVQQTIVTTFQWYSGRIDDASHPLAGNSPEMDVMTSAPGTYYAWVRVTTPCAASAAEFRIDVSSARNRAVRH